MLVPITSMIRKHGLIRNSYQWIQLQRLSFDQFGNESMILNGMQLN